MSRVGRLPINIPTGVNVEIKGHEVTVAGPKGKLARTFNPRVTIAREDGRLVVTREGDDRAAKSLHGLTRALLANMVTGVTQGFERGLEIVGVGYRVEKSGDKLVLRTGFSHPVEVNPVPGLTFTVEGTTKFKVSGVDKEAVGQMAANLRGIKPADPYKGKGIRYAGEVIKLKAGKAGKAVGGK